MKILVYNYGYYAHGTIKKLGDISREDLDNPENSKEYALRPKIGDDCWNNLLEFRIDFKHISV